MTFAIPIAFALAALAVPIIAFYVLKLRLRRVPISTNMFWKQIFEEKPPRSLFQNLKHLISLLLQLSMLLLLIFAIADPYFPWQLKQARRMVLVIDNSASMRAADILPSRFEAARKSAHDVIDGLRFRDEVAIVLAGKNPEVIVGMTNHAPTLRRALDSLTLSDLPTDLEPAIELGKHLIGDKPNGQVVVYTDGCVLLNTEPMALATGLDATTVGPIAPAASADGSGIAYRLFGTHANNIGITQFQVRRSLVDALGYEALASVTNASPIALSCRLELTLDDVPIDVLPLDLQAGETWSRSIEKTSLKGGRLVASLTKIRESESTETVNGKVDEKVTAVGLNKTVLNSLTTDDTAWAILPSRQVQKVLIVSEGNLFLRKVFEANPLVQVEWRKDFPAEWPSDSIVVLHNQVPAVLPRGNLFVIDPSNSSDLWDVGPILDNAIVTEQDKNSPLMTHIRLDNVVMSEVKQLQFKSPPLVLAATVSGDAIFAELRRDQGKTLVLNVNLDKSDLAFRTAFPIMVANALSWFAGQNGELRESMTTGSTANVDLSVNADIDPSKLIVRSPSGKIFSFQISPPPGQLVAEPMALATGLDSATVGRMAPAASADGSGKAKALSLVSPATIAGHIGPFQEVGIWSVAEQADNASPSTIAEPAPLYEVAVNLSSARESDLQPSKVLQDLTQDAPSLSSWLGRPVWFYLICVACALTMLEWIFYQRRVIT